MDSKLRELIEKDKEEQREEKPNCEKCVCPHRATCMQTEEEE